MLVAYVSGHGFGHATRTGEVLRVLRRMEPGLRLAVVTSGPEALYRRAIPGGFVFRSLECDVGVAQVDALVIDEALTAQRCRTFAARFGTLVGQEARWLMRVKARLVLGDVPPLAFAAAEAAGIPSVGLANFSWDWIYRHLASRQASLEQVAEEAAAAYGRAALLLELPFAGELGAFPRREAIPLVARRPRVTGHEARRRLGLGQRNTVLVSFGGIGMPGFGPQVLSPLPYQFVVSDGTGPLPDNVRRVDGRALEQADIGYADLVAAADVVLTKPGYGIVSDAIGAGTRILYTERGDFPEYPILVEGMRGYVPAAHVGNEDVRTGRLGAAIEALLAHPLPDPPSLRGAQLAAERLRRLLRGTCR
jgi:L-arabinokinase